MPAKTAKYSLDFLEKNSNKFEFGSFLRNIRQAKNISIRQLAKSVKKTAAYLSDIEKGNNKPPDKLLLEAIINELQISDRPKLKNCLFDLAAIARNDIPADVKDYICNNKTILNILRILKDNPNSTDIWLQIEKQYSNLEENYGKNK